MSSSSLAAKPSPVSDHGGSSPLTGLVSVLIRSMGRPQLVEALQSVAAQTHPHVEVVLVNASGTGHPPLPELSRSMPIVRVEPGQPLGRSAAANAALMAARGDWLLFLDDDDLLDPDHLSRLLYAVLDQPGFQVAYAGVRMLNADDQPAGVLDEPFSLQRLWLANFLPIHGVLFARQLLQQGYRFDESFDAYEDWDFWLQLAQRHAFLHVPGVSATYRLVGDSGLSAQRDEVDSIRRRQQVYRKWFTMISSDTLEGVARYAEVQRAWLAAREQSQRQLEHQIRVQAEQLQAALQHAATAEARGSDLAHQLEHQGATAREAMASAALAHQLAAQAREITDLKQAALDQLGSAARQQARTAEQLQEQLAASRRELHAALDLQAGLDADRLQLQARLEAARQEHEQRLGQLEQARQQLAEAAATDQSLQQQLAHAHAVYAQLEAGYRNMERSLSWRMTAPLRALRGMKPLAWLRDAVRALPVSGAKRQEIKTWMFARPWAHPALRWVAPLSMPAAAPPPMAPPPPTLDEKQRIRAEAESSLGQFLTEGRRIELRCTDPQPVVSVIVVVFNQAGLSRLCLDALAASQGTCFETLIVDNGSSDRIPELLGRVDGATILRPGSNLGFLRAVNLAAEQARGRYLLLLNNDALVEPGSLARAVARLEREPTAGAVGGPILLWGGSLQEAGSIIWADGSCLGYGRGDAPELPSYRYVRDVDYCSGAFLMVRRALFESMGRFDEAFAPAYYEESDFCARLWEQGHRIVYDPQVRVRHFEFASETASGQAIELQRRNRALFVQRHPDFLAARPAPAVAAIPMARQRIPRGALRVLVIDDRVPLPWLGQGYPRAASIVKALADRGHAVTHYPLQFPQEDWHDVYRALPETVEVMLNLGLPGLARFLDERTGLYDCVIVSRPHNMGMLRTVLEQDSRRLAGVRVVYDAEAMFSVRDIEKAALDGTPLDRPEQEQRIAQELALAQGADSVLAVSELEARHYRGAGYTNVQVLGHALEPALHTPGFEARRGFLFLGALTEDDTPNSDSVVWFVREVWPLIVQAQGSEARFDIVGECTAPSVLALQAPGIVIHGRVPDLGPKLDAARVFVVPTRYAAGIPHKAHEAAARGLPMVVSSLIARQLGWSKGEVAVAEDAAAFAQACLALHADAERWASTRATLLAAVSRECSPAAFRHALDSALQAAKPSPRPASEPALEFDA